MCDLNLFHSDIGQEPVSASQAFQRGLDGEERPACDLTAMQEYERGLALYEAEMERLQREDEEMYEAAIQAAWLERVSFEKE